MSIQRLRSLTPKDGLEPSSQCILKSHLVSIYVNMYDISCCFAFALIGPIGSATNSIIFLGSIAITSIEILNST